jgi:MFS family permease
MRFPAGLRALNHREFRLFWTGQWVSLVGRWMQSIGQAWLVLDLTRSPFKLGVVTGLQFAPILVLSFVAGAVADRVAKRWLVIGTQLGLMVPALILGLLCWTGQVQYWHVAALAAVVGVVNALDMPARQSMIVELVGKEDLGNAIALNSASFNAARTVGPALAGLLIDRFGVTVAFLANGLSFLAVVAALLAARPPARPPAPRVGGLRREIAAGLGYAARTPLVVLVLSLILTVSVFALNHQVMVPLLAREVLHQDAHGFGLLMSSLGVGAVVGALALAALGEGRPRVAQLLVPALVVTVATMALAGVRQAGLAAMLLFVIGVAQILLTAGCNTALQLTVPDALRGRVMALYTLVFAGMSPAGAFLVGGLAELFDAPTAFLAGGGAGLLSVVVLAALLARRAAAGEDPRPARA